MEQIEKLVMDKTVEVVFDQWKRLAHDCESLNWLIQNNLDIIGEEDLKRWEEQVRGFRAKLSELIKYTHGMVKQHLERKRNNGKKGQSVRQAGQDCEEGQ